LRLIQDTKLNNFAETSKMMVDYREPYTIF